jgi:hypothetical protein
MWYDVLKVKQITTPTTDINIKKIPKKKNEKTECRDWLKGLYDLFEKNKEMDTVGLQPLKWSHDFPENFACIIKNLLLREPRPRFRHVTYTQSPGYSVALSFDFDKNYTLSPFASLYLRIDKSIDEESTETDGEVLTPLENIVNMELFCHWSNFENELLTPNIDRTWVAGIMEIQEYIKSSFKDVGNNSILRSFFKEYLGRNPSDFVDYDDDFDYEGWFNKSKGYV